MAHSDKHRIWIPSELAAAPFLMGMGLVIAYDALTPFLDGGASASLVEASSLSDTMRTVLFLVVALGSKRARLLFNQPWFLALACVACSVGMALTQLAPFITDPFVATGVTVVGSVGICVFWGGALLKFYELFTRVSLPCALVTFIFCHLVGSSLATVIVYLSARTAALLLLFALPLILLAWGVRCKSFVLLPVDTESVEETRRLRIPVRPYALMLVTLLVAAMVRAHIPTNLEPATYLGPLVCSLVLAILIEAKRRAVHPRMLYYLTLFLLMLGLLLYTLQGDVALIASGASVNAGYACFDVLISVLLCNVCRRYSINSYWVFGLLGFIERLSYDSGDAAGALLNSQPEEVRYLVAFGCAIVVTCAFVTLLTERDYRTSWGTMRDEEKENPVAYYYQSLPEACAAISEQYGLTRREEDVLLLLAQRKTVPDIERELYISNSTAKTHCKNIYKKLGIHKREELLTLMGHPSVLQRDDQAE